MSYNQYNSIIMKYQEKKIDLLNNTPNQTPKFRTQK